MFCGKRQRKTRAQSSSLPPSSQIEVISTSVDKGVDAPLCSTCSALHLRTILHDGIAEKNAVPLGHLTDILKKDKQCGLCGLVASVIRRMWQLDKLPAINLTGITCALHAEHCGYPKIQNKTLPVLRDVCHRLYITTSFRPRDVYIAMRDAQSHFELEIQLLEEDASKVNRTRELHGRRIGDSVDINLLKRWIHTCENEHGETCEKVWWRGVDDVLPKSVRVVDVTRMAIVPAPLSCRYVALSYVWGGPGEGYWTTKANLKRRSTSGGLDASMMPGTISDTIQLVRQLGERYLWIDALCIVQDDPEDKAVQIGVMELIYGSSVFTVIAVGCTSARDPLPGVRPGTRDPKQQIVKIQGLHLAVPLAVPNEDYASSVWNERGWTYQEVMLSRRRIFFTAQQVHFECRRDVWNEDVVAEHINLIWDQHPLKYNGAGQLTSTSALPRRNEASYVTKYMDIVGEYTQRKLTVESDIVDAVTAFLNAFTKRFNLPTGPGKAFRFGMPLVDLERALLWQPAANAPHSRRVPSDGTRAPWPSWSWAAWRGATRYEDSRVFVDVQSSSGGNANGWMYQSLVGQWYIIDNDGKPFRQDVRRIGRSGEYFMEAHSRTYVAQKGEIDPQKMLTENAPLRPGTLVFRTSSAHFKVTKADDVASAKVATNYVIYSILSDIPQPSTLVGRIILPSFTRSPSSYEFVVLSRADKLSGLYDENRLGEPYSGCMLYVMAVQKIQDEKRILERVGLGVIFEHAWLNSRTEQKMVFLG